MKQPSFRWALLCRLLFSAIEEANAGIERLWHKRQMSFACSLAIEFGVETLNLKANAV